MAAIVVAVAAVVGGHVLSQRGHVVNGVSVAGVPLGGQDELGARRTLNAGVAPLLHRPIEVRAAGRSARVVPARLGIRVDERATVKQALRVGRLPGALFSIGFHRDLEPVLHLPAHFVVPVALLRGTRRPVDARLALGPRGGARVTPSRPGIGFANRRALAAIGRAALAGRRVVRLSPVAVPAPISTAAAERARLRVRRMLSAPVLIQHGSKPSGELVVAQLAPLLVAHPYAHQIAVAFDPERVRHVLLPLLGHLLRAPRDATWQPVGERAVVLSSVNGVALDARATARHLTAAALHQARRQRVARLGLTVVHPRFTTREARAMHVTSVIASFTSDMGASSSNRIFNVHLMADILQGHVIRPGTGFSFNEVVGPRTAERGFREGQAIENGLLVPSIGGGVCQVATTIYNAAFHAGLPIVQRTNHSFYISHYPLGMDATVADGGPDLIFRNDTGHPIVIKTAYTDQTLTVNLLSAPLHRTVEMTTSEPRSYTDPRSRYIADPEVADGQIVQETEGERGFDVSVTRTVYGPTGGQIGEPQTFASHYSPEDVIYGMGKGAVLPGQKPKHKPGTASTGTDTSGTATTGSGTDTTGTGTTTGDAGTASTPTSTAPAPPTSSAPTGTFTGPG